MGAPNLAPSAASTTTTTTASSSTTTTAAAVTTTRRLRREDFLRTKHDSAFSKWQVLIGPWDWEDHSAGKEGAERYRVANLPAVSGPGLYEIGVAVWRTGSGRNVARLEPDRIVVVYLGQAENVRSRLQHYGRSGSHLVHCYDQRTSLFSDVFRRGYPIVYRWALTATKTEAERTESMLLSKFDYAWNKVGNGARRPDDVLSKISKIESRNTHIPKVVKMLTSLSSKKVGIPIQASKPSHHHDEEETLSFFDRVLKFGRSQPRLVSANPKKHCISQADVCGVGLSNGSVCNEPPVQGRKRCAQHKGMRLASRTPKQEKYVSDSAKIAVSDNFPARICTKNVVGDNFAVNDNFSAVICGVGLSNGSVCSKPPVQGRKRCSEEKGMRIMGSASRTTPKPEKSLSDSVEISVNDNKNAVSDNNFDAGVCGVMMPQLDGSMAPCSKPPFPGRKRCLEHRGMRINHQVSLSSPSSLAALGITAYCGADLGDGKWCMAQPVKGRKRCEKHKGKRAASGYIPVL